MIQINSAEKQVKQTSCPKAWLYSANWDSTKIV